MTLSIRLATHHDLDAVRYIGFATWPSTYGPLKGHRYVVEGLDSYWNAQVVAAAIEAGTIHIAESEQGVVGVTEVEEHGADLIMWKLYVLPSQQRSGLGHALVSAAKERARARGCDLVTQYVRENTRAGGFYLSEEFEPTPASRPGAEAVWLRWRRNRPLRTVAN